MLDRAKYVKQAASNIENAFTSVAKSATELYLKDAETEANDAWLTMNEELTGIHTEQMADTTIAPEVAEDTWLSRAKPVLDKYLKNVKNKKAKEYLTDLYTKSMTTKSASIKYQAIQNRQDNIKTRVVGGVENAVENMGPGDTVDGKILEVSKILGYNDETGELDAYFNPAETERVFQLAKRDIYIADAQISIDEIINRDASQNGKTGYQVAKEYLAENERGFTREELKDLDQYVETAHRDRKNEREKAASEFNQAAQDSFMQTIIDSPETGVYLTENDVIDFYKNSPIPIDTYGKQMEWLQYAQTQADQRALADIVTRVSNNEEVSPEEVDNLKISDKEKLIIKENANITGEPAPAGESITPSVSSSSSSSDSTGLPSSMRYGIDLDEPNAVRILDAKIFESQLSDSEFDAMVMSYSNQLTSDTIESYLKKNRDFVLDEGYQDVEQYIDNRVDEWFKEIKDPVSGSQWSVRKILKDMTNQMLSRNPDMLNDVAGLENTINNLFNDHVVGKKIEKDFERYADLRNGGETFEQDLKNTDTGEQLMNDIADGKYQGMISMDVIGSVVSAGFSVDGAGFEEVSNKISKAYFGDTYENIKGDIVMKNIADLSIAYSIMLNATKNQFVTEVVPELGNKKYVSVISQHGLVFIDSDGFAYRSKLNQGQKPTNFAESWEKAEVGASHYREGFAGTNTAPLPNDLKWQNSNYTALYYLKQEEAKKAERAEDLADRAIRPEPMDAAVTRENLEAAAPLAGGQHIVDNYFKNDPYTPAGPDTMDTVVSSNVEQASQQAMALGIVANNWTDRVNIRHTPDYVLKAKEFFSELWDKVSTSVTDWTSGDLSEKRAEEAQKESEGISTKVKDLEFEEKRASVPTVPPVKQKKQTTEELIEYLRNSN